ncbi:hypothetical protein BH11ARM1_BH11ARM1_17390 [soil metagenome]
MKRKFYLFLLDCGIVVTLVALLMVAMGFSLTWTVVGAALAFDLSVIVYLARRSEPPVKFRHGRQVLLNRTSELL